ncbi:Uncharacterized protein Rs2_40884 [Raphanus sativus]|nr:Uncharacterized protein Rs2_40884 [Raphanus sativus]
MLFIFWQEKERTQKISSSHILLLTLLAILSLPHFSAKHQTFTVSRILDERERAPVPDCVTDEGSNGPEDDMHGYSSLPTKVIVGNNEKENSPGSETTSSGVINT